MNRTAHVLHIQGPMGIIALNMQAIFDNLLAYLQLTPRWLRCSHEFHVDRARNDEVVIGFRTFEGFGYEMGRPVETPELSFILESADEGHHYENPRFRLLTEGHSSDWKPSWHSLTSEEEIPQDLEYL
jgi:hypothetical protein